VAAISAVVFACDPVGGDMDGGGFPVLAGTLPAPHRHRANRKINFPA
jgi:hypothetical protein